MATAVLKIKAPVSAGKLTRPLCVFRFIKGLGHMEYMHHDVLFGSMMGPGQRRKGGYYLSLVCSVYTVHPYHVESVRPFELYLMETHRLIASD